MFCFVGSTSDVCKEISDSTQRKWIKGVYAPLGLAYSKVTHAGRGSGTKYAELLNIHEDQIRRAAHWNSDAMHKGYLTTLPREFMRGMAGFDPKHPGTYHIARSAITPPSELLSAFWSPLDAALGVLFNDIATNQFVKLLQFLRIVFLQDSVFLRQKYPRHPLFDHSLFNMPEYGVFAEAVLANSVEKATDQNTLIRTALPHLGQQVVDLHVGLSGLLNAGFQKQETRFNLMEGKLDDFLTGKVTFTLTPSNIRQHRRAISPMQLNLLDPSLRPSSYRAPAVRRQRASSRASNSPPPEP